MSEPKTTDSRNDRTTAEAEISAGVFSSWLRRTRMGLIRERGASVPCGDCRGCCVSSYFIHIRPEEKKTLARIDRKLLFPAPGLPKGHRLMGFFDTGFCPMMQASGCAIYEDRPSTCRNYDCRIFTAAGIPAGEEDKAVINRQVARWAFEYPTQRDRDLHKAVQAAARFLREHAELFPPGFVPTNPSQLALLALKVYGVFTAPPESGTPMAEAVLKKARAFDARVERERNRGAGPKGD